MSKIDGYARVITDIKGNIINVEEWYTGDLSLDTYLKSESFQDWIDESEHKDAEVLITYKFWSDKTWTDYGYEYDAGLDIIDEYLLKSNYQLTFKDKISKMLESIKNESEAFFLDEYQIGFPTKKEAQDYVDSLIEEYEELYDEEFVST